MNITIGIAFLVVVLAVNGSKGGVGDISLWCALDGEASSRSGSSGVLEVLTGSGGWSAVSSSGFGGVEAQVVCVQLGYIFVSNVSTLSVTSRRLEIIIERITCNGTENSLRDCLLEVSQNPQATDLSLVYISCDTVRNTSNNVILFLLDNPFFMASNYPEVNRSRYTTYTMIEPSQNIYNEGCLTEKCTPGGHFYMLGTIHPGIESFILPQLQHMNCSRREEVRVSLTEFMFINTSDCIFNSTGKIMISDDQQFCSVESTKVSNTASVIHSMWLWNIIMVLSVGGAVNFY